MGYVVAHIDKSKSGQSGGLTQHIDRTQKENNISKNIDTSRSKLNFELVEKTGTIDEMIKDRIKQGYTGTKAIRKDAVTSCRCILSGSHDDMMKLSNMQLKQWAIDNYKYFSKKYGEKNIIRATVHVDEKTPHMHLIFVPLTADGKLSAKKIIGNKKDLKKFQSDYAEQIGKKYGLKRGVEDTNRKHLTTKDYYRYVNKNELTAEELINHENSKELVGKLIELTDDKKEKRLLKTAHKKLQKDEPRQDIERTKREQRKPRIDKGNSFEIG